MSVNLRWLGGCGDALLSREVVMAEAAASALCERRRILSAFSLFSFSTPATFFSGLFHHVRNSAKSTVP